MWRVGESFSGLVGGRAREVEVVEEAVREELERASRVKSISCKALVINVLIFSLALALGIVNAMSMSAVIGMSFLEFVPIISLIILSGSLLLFAATSLFLAKKIEQHFACMEEQVIALKVEEEERLEAERREEEVRKEEERGLEEIRRQEKAREEPTEKEIIRVEKRSFLEKIPGVGSFVEEWVKESFRSCAYVKKEVREQEVGVLEQAKYVSPSFAAKEFARVTEFWPQGDKPEIQFKEGDRAAEERSKRELMFILLGFLSFEQLEDINKMYQEGRRGKVGDNVWLNELYAKCIKKYPKLVAAEAAYFAWIKSSFPYLLVSSHAVFHERGNYRAAIFLYLDRFLRNSRGSENKKALSFLEKFAGFVPACFAVFQTAPWTMGLSVCPHDVGWDWSSYCRNVTEFCKWKVLEKRAFGDGEALRRFIEEEREEIVRGGSEIYLNGKDATFGRQVDCDFSEKPRALWDMASLCNKDKELREKIEEGLRALSGCGYLGEESVEEIQAFEKEILGLKESVEGKW
ncbi:hypothetical protein [Chlamydiifrater phoenicopteri]|uniref:hypothetical protein n=1 Tax=Chlamydiifrater phoenicopteri TaxID=2681469 RepID=UPI001BD0B326|nr:hypothetical protein [Chlamydiifrater phoenicopteri]